MYFTVLTQISMPASGIYFVLKLCALLAVYVCEIVSHLYS